MNNMTRLVQINRYCFAILFMLFFKCLRINKVLLKQKKKRIYDNCTIWRSLLKYYDHHDYIGSNTDRIRTVENTLEGMKEGEAGT